MMNKRVLILDTSILCCWLQIPGKEEAETPQGRWTHTRIDALLKKEEKIGSIFVLPVATLIETGNHIAQVVGNRFSLATKLANYLKKAADADSPWAAFTEQSDLWQTKHLLVLAKTWPTLAAQKLSIGDATIKNVAKYYDQAGYIVEILTSDQDLKAYEPSKPACIPRRRKIYIKRK